MAIIGDGGLSALLPGNAANQQQPQPRENAANGGAASRSGGRGDGVVIDLSPEARAIVRPTADAVTNAPADAGAADRDVVVERRQAEATDEATEERRADSDRDREAAVERRSERAEQREERVDIRV